MSESVHNAIRTLSSLLNIAVVVGVIGLAADVLGIFDISFRWLGGADAQPRIEASQQIDRRINDAVRQLSATNVALQERIDHLEQAAPEFIIVERNEPTDGTSVNKPVKVKVDENTFTAPLDQSLAQKDSYGFVGMNLDPDQAERFYAPGGHVVEGLNGIRLVD